MKAINVQRPTWKEVLNQSAPLLLPVAHDALTARIIERTGFKAYQAGGFAMSGTMHAVPDLDLEHFGEKSSVVRKIVNACSLPLLVDADDGYGDAKNVTRTVQEYELMGVAALFIEDQVAPKKCGHMSGKQVIPKNEAVNKIKAACAARRDSDFFILARTDAIEPEGVRSAIRRAEAYLQAGADGVYLEGPTAVKELKQIGKALNGAPLAVSILEGGGKTPWMPPEEFYELGFTMLLYPTSILFRMTRAIERAAEDLFHGEALLLKDAVSMNQFEEIVDLQHWNNIQKKFS